MIESGFFATLWRDLHALYSTSVLITVLTLLSLWAWKLIFDVWMQIQSSEVKHGAFFQKYEIFCQKIVQENLNKKLENKMLHTEAKSILRSFKQKVNTILLLSSLAPFLGLLGTVQGMIHTFTVLASAKTVNSANLTSGISEALLTTECGLLVAIPTLLVGGILHRKTQKIEDRLRIIAVHSSENTGEHYEMA